ncbi:MAG: hypothetical protein FJ088_12365, partial [Deltaproteobacteria bacterium]|nr:hypothetical protein [Deltaproteobacteria bacterium]
GFHATPVWRILLPVGEKLMGTPTIFGGVSYFTTFFPLITDACSPGTGRLWGVNYEKNGGTLDQIIGKLDEQGTTHTIITGAIPYGVEVVQRLACSEGKSLDAALNQGVAPPELRKMEGGTPTLVIQTATKSSASDETVPVGSNIEPIVAKKLMELRKPPSTIFASSWGMVFD